LDLHASLALWQQLLQSLKESDDSEIVRKEKIISVLQVRDSANRQGFLATLDAAMSSRDEVVQGKLQQILAMLAGFTADINYAWLKDESPSGESGLMQMARYPQHFSKILSLFAHLKPWQKRDLLQQSNKHFSGDYLGTYMQLPAMASHRQTLISMVERERLLPEVQCREQSIHRFRKKTRSAAWILYLTLLAQDLYALFIAPSTVDGEGSGHLYEGAHLFDVLQAQVLPVLLFAMLLVGYKKVGRLPGIETGQRAYAALLGRRYRALGHSDALLETSCLVKFTVTMMGLLSSMVSGVGSPVSRFTELPIIVKVIAVLFPIAMSVANGFLAENFTEKLLRLMVLTPSLQQRLMAEPVEQGDRAELEEVRVQPVRHVGMGMGR
jgi:hypothetical protein